MGISDSLLIVAYAYEQPLVASMAGDHEGA